MTISIFSLLQACSAASGEGVKDGLDWVSKNVKKA